jgi:hydrophobic/amphiphilic exporter-1 (mainly G- bacteria), HAE1 family
LLVSFTLTPMLSSRFIKVNSPEEVAAHKGSKDSRLFHFLDVNYTRMLEWAMGHRKSMIALCVMVSLTTVPLFMLVGKNLFAQDDRSEFQVTVKAPEGTSLAGTLTIAERIARDLPCPALPRRSPRLARLRAAL